MESLHLASPWQAQDLKTWGSLISPDYLTDYPQDAVIFWQGQVDPFVYIVKEGRVVLRAASADGREKILMFGEKGGLFGEVGAFEPYPQPQSYSAVTLVASRIYKIPLEVFLNKMQTDQNLCWAVLAMISRKASLHINQVLGLSFGDIRYRVAGVFRYLIDTYGVPTPQGVLLEVPFTHQDMADLVKSSRVSVSKIFKEFNQQGILAKVKGRYIITNTQLLDEIVKNV